MKTNLIHRACGSRLIGVRRTIVVEPDDATWPRDVSLNLPYCPACKTLVSIDDTAVTMQGSTN